MEKLCHNTFTLSKTFKLLDNGETSEDKSSLVYKGIVSKSSFESG